MQMQNNIANVNSLLFKKNQQGIKGKETMNEIFSYASLTNFYCVSKQRLILKYVKMIKTTLKKINSVFSKQLYQFGKFLLCLEMEA